MPAGKTLSIFKFTPVTQYSLLNFANSALYCNHYHAFNDPFECWCDVRCGFPSPVTDRSRYLEVIAAWGFSDGDDAVAQENYPSYAEELTDYQPNTDEVINSARIACFSRSADNLLMWGHYANGLRGFCIEFDGPRLINKKPPRAELFPVEYKDEPPVVDTAIYAVADDQVWYHERALEELGAAKKRTAEARAYRESARDARETTRDLYRKMLATKPREWEYEQEIRLIYHTANVNQAGELYYYDRASIKSIILGERMPSEDRDALLEIVRRNRYRIPVKVARRERLTYRVVLE